MPLDSPSPRIALGTAQFGFDYGLANGSGKVPLSEVRSILRTARSRGIDTIDTAIAYGDSESTLGRAGAFEWRVVTKLPPLPAETTDVAAWVRENVEASRERLGCERLYGVLLHRSSDLASSRGMELLTALREEVASGRAAKIGVSIYDPEELDRLDGYTLDIVQAPYNVLDRRLSVSGWLDRLRSRGTEVHCRSVFLQGLLLMDFARRPARFEPWEGTLALWDTWVAAHSCTRLEAALGFVLEDARVDRVVVGIDSHQQLVEVIAAANHTPQDQPPADLHIDDPLLINPATWGRS